MKPPRDSNPQRLARLGLLLTAMALSSGLWSAELPGTVVAVAGDTITVETEIIAGLSPAPGDAVDVIISSTDGAHAMPAGTWRVTRLNGVMVTAEKTDRVFQPAMVGMEAVVHVSGTADREGPSVFVPGDNASTPRGKVIMLRDELVTIALDTGASSVVPQAGDELQLQFTVAGESLVVGTWRVTAVKNDNTVEAEPVELIQPPSIGYQAVFLPKEAKPETPVASTQPPSREQSVDSPAESTPRHPAAGAGRTETEVTRDFSGTRDKTPCDLGSVRLRDNRLEMTASKGDTEEYCFHAIADQSLADFRASTVLEVDGKDFLVGFAFGDLNGPAADRMVAYLATMNTKVGSGRKRDEVWGAWLGSISVTRRGRSDTGFMKDPWFEEDDKSDNPTPGTLEFVKDGPDCSLSWNGERFLNWREDEIQQGTVGIMFKPIDGRRNTAAFSNISVKRLD